MAKDLYDRLCRFYEFMLGSLARRDEFKRTLRETVAEEDLSVFFLLPFVGAMPLSKLQGKAKMPPEDLGAALDRLASEGFVMAYHTLEGPTYERGNVVFMTEQQVRKPEDTPRRTFYAEFFDSYLSGESLGAVPTKTPYYRVVPVESTVVAPSTPRTIPVNVPIPDPRQVLPVDVVSEVIRREASLIGVAQCYCRKTKRIIGNGCDHPLETCFVFNELAETLIANGLARQVDYEEAMEIIWHCEELGLVHNVDNCVEKVRSLCNCCACSCGIPKTWEMGMTNAGGPSRYVVLYDAARCTGCEACIPRCPTPARRRIEGQLVVDAEQCVGCGLCVTACPEGANHMVLREELPAILPDHDALYGKIGREAIVGMVKRRLLGR